MTRTVQPQAAAMPPFGSAEPSIETSPNTGVIKRIPHLASPSMSTEAASPTLNTLAAQLPIETAPAPEPVPSKIPLRERKYARTKLSLMRSAVDRLREKPFSEITVKELCEEAQVSEATFFNYFPKKEDVLRYFIQIWTMHVSWRAEIASGGDHGLRFIEELFAIMGRELAECPRIMMEVISFMTLDRSHADCPFTAELSLAERIQAFPELDCPNSIACRKLDQVLSLPIQRAMAQGELPDTTDIEQTVITLLSLFFGIPLVLKGEPAQIPDAYQKQLKQVWAGARNLHR